MNAKIVIPVHTTGHPLLLKCIRNAKETTGTEPIVWECDGNVSVARNQAMDAIDADWICFLDTDAFPQEKNWLGALVDTAERHKVTLVQPHEILDFGESRSDMLARSTDTIVKAAPTNCAGMCLLVKRDACRSLFDEGCGLTAGHLGPCIEDTDFACAVANQGGALAFTPHVHVLHRDRGVKSEAEFRRTDEYLAYMLMWRLLEIKWHPKNSGIRKGFFRGLKKVPSKGQRWMADGFTFHDLLECYLPVLEQLPDAERPKCQKALISTIDSFRQESEKKGTL